MQEKCLRSWLIDELSHLIMCQIFTMIYVANNCLKNIYMYNFSRIDSFLPFKYTQQNLQNEFSCGLIFENWWKHHEITKFLCTRKKCSRKVVVKHCMRKKRIRKCFKILLKARQKASLGFQNAFLCSSNFASNTERI